MVTYPNKNLSVADNENEYIDMLLNLLSSDKACSDVINFADQALLEHFSISSAVDAIDKIMGTPAN